MLRAIVRAWDAFRERRRAFKLPENEPNKVGPGFGDYMLKQSRKGSQSDSDLLDRRLRQRYYLVIFISIALMGWLIYEFVYSLRFFEG
ncbi:MAG: hypothetical protein MK080_02955 [Opitutales bacterium]|nr:hypothetical protein [Opitutales bacterium]NRA26028.1 hypothetical protein [Opitutales bacterium]